VWSYHYESESTPIRYPPIWTRSKGTATFRIDSKRDSVFVLNCKYDGVQVIATIKNPPPYDTIGEYRYDSSTVSSNCTYLVSKQNDRLIFSVDSGYDNYGLQDFSTKYAISFYSSSNDTIKIIDTTIEAPFNQYNSESYMKIFPGIGVIERAENRKEFMNSYYYYKYSLTSYGLFE
jgi:hypothetical protein